MIVKTRLICGFLAVVSLMCQRSLANEDLDSDEVNQESDPLDEALEEEEFFSMEMIGEPVTAQVVTRQPTIRLSRQPTIRQRDGRAWSTRSNPGGRNPSIIERRIPRGKIVPIRPRR